MSELKSVVGGDGSLVGFLVSKVPAMGLGVLAAVITVVAIDRWRATPVPVPAQREEGLGVRSARESQAVARSIVDQRAFDRIAELERQMREMQESKIGPVEQGFQTPKEEPSNPDQTRRELDEMYAELDRSHERDAPDPEWAPAATRDLLAGLKTLGDKFGFTVGAADCRTTTCRASVTWGNFADARSTQAKLVEYYFGSLNCVQAIRLPEPRDPNLAYTSQLYLDCTDLRAGLADEIVALGGD